MKNLKSKEFLALAEIMLKSNNTPKIAYKTPDSWRGYSQ